MSEKHDGEVAHGTSCEDCGSSWLYRTVVKCEWNPRYCPVCGSETGPQLRNFRGESDAQ